MINVSLLLGGGGGGTGFGKYFRLFSGKLRGNSFLSLGKKKAPYNFIHNLGENKFKSVYYIFNFKIVIKAGSLYLL